LLDLFDALIPPALTPGVAHFSAQPVPGHDAHRIGKDPEGSPCLLLHVTGGTVGSVFPPIVLSHLAVQHDVHCRISRPEQPPEEATFTLIRCLSRDAALVAKFLDVMEVVVRTVGRASTAERVRRAVEELAELFRSLDRPPRKSARGVWAELFLMALSQDPGRLAAAWHAAPGEAFDFSEGSDRLEVKAAGGGAREHYFSLVQVHPAHGMRVLVASLLAEALAGGTPVKRLLAELRGRLATRPELALRVERIAAQSLGKSWTPALDESFDWQRAEDSLRFFEAHRIPAVPKELPREVSDVRFRSDLSGCASLGLEEARQRGGLFEAL
jgi:hypothetical protein